MYDIELYRFVKESNRIKNILREPTKIETEAHQKFLALGTITVEDMEEFVSTICGAKLRRKLYMDVMGADHLPPPGGHDIEIRLTQLLANAMDYAAVYNTHLAYEELHPFMDGNGRSGRVLWLWMMGGTAPLGFLHEFYYQTLAAQEE